ncbi:heavy metal translocating P-type ATPase [Candidatus Dependentiae bacterium]|nr:heavy metal translocating P-type ATPase [Candidatus Dependentiae bacterium]
MDSSKNKNNNHHNNMVKDFFRRFIICSVLTIPVLLLSKTIQEIISFKISFSGSSYILFICSSFIFIYGSIPFFKGFISEIKKFKPGMMTLISLAVSVAYIYSSFVFWQAIQGKIFFWEVVTLIDIMLLGHYIEMKSVLSASKSVEKLVSLLPSTVHLYVDENETKDIDIEKLEEGDKVLVKPGESIPADGVIIKGSSRVNQAFLTGESKPIQKETDDEVIGGSLNIDGSLTVLVKGTGKDSYLSRMIDLVSKASKKKSRSQSIADKVAMWLTIIAIVTGIITLLSWVFIGKNFSFSLERMVSVMVITCPHALGLAIPLVIAVVTSLAAKNGFLIKDRVIFEKTRQVDTVVFDKTGTLTKGKFKVSKIISLSDWDKDEILIKAASIESLSEHGIGLSILDEAKKRKFKLKKVDNFKSLPGKGVLGQISQEIFVGSLSGLKDTFTNVFVDENKIKEYEKDGAVIVVAIKEEIKGIIVLSDEIREESKEACSLLKERRIKVVMITGDTPEVAKKVAEKLGIDEFFARVLPDEKAKKIKQLQKKGNFIAMVGDGINDAPALAQADAGIAIGAGTDIAAETADIILVKNDPRNVLDILNLSKITYKKMIQNLIWASGYNFIAIPLAAGVLYKYNILISPALGAIIMSISTVIVAINARLVSLKKINEK